MAKVLWRANDRVWKDDGTLATSGTLTIRLADTATTQTAYTDRNLSVTQSVFNIGSDGYIENKPTIYGADDIGYDAYIQSTGVNGSVAWTIPDLAIADSSTSDATESATGFKNLLRNGSFSNWLAGTSFSNISGDNDGDETADDWYFAQPSVASNAVSRQTAARTGARYGYRFGRPVGSTSTNKLRVWQTIATEEAIRCRGQTVSISFNAYKGANFSGVSLSIRLETGTSEGEDGDLIESGGFGGAATPLNTAQALTTTSTRYEFQATIGSNVGEMGLQFSFTGVGTAGADDWVQIEDIQIEIADTATSFEAPPETVEYLRANLSTGGRLVVATTFTDPNADRVFGWDDSAGAFIGFSTAGALSITGTTISVTAAGILTQLLTVDGAGSGLDADLLDGNSSAFYLAASSYTAADVLSKLLTVDGAGSGLDADLLDGNSSAFFSPASVSGTAAAILASLLTVDGAGSGLDADTLDGANIGTSGAAVPLLNGANTWSSAQTISLTAAGTALTLQSSDAGASTGPNLVFYRNSASAAAADDLSDVAFQGNDSGGNQTTYARFRVSIVDPTDASEDGGFEFHTIFGGALAARLRIRGGLFHSSAAGGDKGDNTLNLGTLYQNNVQVATLSGSETLTSKTLTSPTINGGALSGTFTGAPTFSGGPTLTSPTINGGTIQSRVQTSSETGGTLTSASDNAIVDLASAPTINDGVHAAGACIVLVNNTASSVTLTQDTGMTLRLHGTTTTGNRTIPARGVCTVLIDPGSNAEALCCGDVS